MRLLDVRLVLPGAKPAGGIIRAMRSKAAGKLDRRQMLKASTAGLVAISTSELIMPATAAPVQSRLSPELRPVLLRAINAIIPGSGKMPSAEEAGALRYLDARFSQDVAFFGEISKFIARLGASRTDDTVVALAEMERTMPEGFATFRDAVYEAYYTNPAIWKLIGYEFRNSITRRAPLPPFEERLLARMRKEARIYREDE
jgi:hypothetical protein